MITNKYGLDPYDMPVIGIDFDGTIVYDAYPEIGEPIPGAIETINKWYNEGFWIVIHSCRAGEYEADMCRWIYENKLDVHRINNNLDWRIEKYGGDTRKMSLDINIDDKNIGMQMYTGISMRMWITFSKYVNEYMEKKYGKSDR